MEKDGQMSYSAHSTKMSEDEQEMKTGTLCVMY